MTKQETKQWLTEARQKLAQWKLDQNQRTGQQYRRGLKYYTDRISSLESDLETMRKAEQKELFG